MIEKLRRIVALYDLHIPENIELDGIYKFLKDFEPTHLILGGDFLHLESVRDLAKAGGFDVKSLEFTRTVEDLEGDFTTANSILDKVDEACPSDCTKVFIEGNHEFWLRQIQDRAPGIKTIFDPALNLRLRDRDYRWIDQNRVYNVGRCYFLHGHYTNKYHSFKHLIAYQRNIFYGHCHTHQTHTITSPLDSDPKTAVSVPCLCHRNADYMRGRPNAWNNGFLVIYSDPNNNHFFPYIVTIIKNNFVAPNGVYY